jgi:peptidoglycan/LPS O-acetylase OafA/YrhL
MNSALHWTLVVVTFVLTVIAAFVPVLLLFSVILPHESSDVPDAMLFWSSVVGSLTLAALMARLVHRKLQQRALRIEVRAAVKFVGFILIMIALAVLPFSVWISTSWGVVALILGIFGAVLLAIGVRGTRGA